MILRSRLAVAATQQVWRAGGELLLAKSPTTRAFASYGSSVAPSTGALLLRRRCQGWATPFGVLMGSARGMCASAGDAAGDSLPSLSGRSGKAVNEAASSVPITRSRVAENRSSHDTLRRRRRRPTEPLSGQTVPSPPRAPPGRQRHRPLGDEPRSRSSSPPHLPIPGRQAGGAGAETASDASSSVSGHGSGSGSGSGRDRGRGRGRGRGHDRDLKRPARVRLPVERLVHLPAVRGAGTRGIRSLSSYSHAVIDCHAGTRLRPCRRGPVLSQSFSYRHRLAHQTHRRGAPVHRRVWRSWRVIFVVRTEAPGSGSRGAMMR